MTQQRYSNFDPHHDESIGFFSRQECMSMNLNFAHAMLAARKRGDEQFTIGPIVDHTPLIGAHFDRELRHSPMSSGAAACLNITLDTSRPQALPAVSFKTRRF